MLNIVFGKMNLVGHCSYRRMLARVTFSDWPPDCVFFLMFGYKSFVFAFNLNLKVFFVFEVA